MNDWQGKQNINDDRTIDLRRIWHALWKRAWLIALITIITGFGVYLYTVAFVAPTYRTGFTAFVNNRLTTEGMSSTTTSDLTASMGLAYVYGEIITSRSVLTDAAKKCNLNISYGALSRMVTASISEEAPVVIVYVEMTDPVWATKLANAICEVAPTHVSRVVEGSSMKVVDSPIEPTGKYAPNNFLNGVMGMLAGFVLSVVIAVAIDLAHDRVQNGEDLENRYHIAIVGTIPDLLQAQKKSSGYYSRRAGTKQP